MKKENKKKPQSRKLWPGYTLQMITDRKIMLSQV